MCRRTCRLTCRLTCHCAWRHKRCAHPSQDHRDERWLQLCSHSCSHMRLRWCACNHRCKQKWLQMRLHPCSHAQAPARALPLVRPPVPAAVRAALYPGGRAGRPGSRRIPAGQCPWLHRRRAGGAGCSCRSTPGVLVRTAGLSAHPAPPAGCTPPHRSACPSAPPPGFTPTHLGTERREVPPLLTRCNICRGAKNGVFVHWDAPRCGLPIASPIASL
jgi:hypothetical protein